MSTGEQSLRALRDALSVSPDNLPLRRHVAASLAGLGRFDEAAAEYREALARAPHDAASLLGLATVYYQQGKNSQSLVVVEDVVKRADAPPAAQLLYARLLVRAGDAENARARYKLALEGDPALEDAELSQRLGIARSGGSQGDRGGEDFSSQGDDVVDGRAREAWGAAPQPFDVEVERPRATFADVGGMDALKEEIRIKIIYPLQHPEMYKAYGKAVGGGILLYGPPGCGKTHLARATAGEIRAGFLSIGINDVLEMWIGNSERNLHAVFDQARSDRPCVLFFDEVDALGGRRSDMHGGAGRNIINQFLSEMDGIGTDNDGLLVLAATNAPWHVDPAFRRPGRFDRVLFVPPPDAPGRAAILRVHCRNKPQEAIDFQRIAEKTDGFSGADLKAVVDQAIEAKLRDAMKQGRPLPLCTADLLAAAKSLKPTTREWFATARNYALYSNQGGLYDDVLKFLKM